MLGRLEVWLGQSLALELGSRMRIVDETHSKHEEMGKDWTQLERPGPSWLMFSTAHSRSGKIRKVRLKVRDASYIQLMRQNGPPCPIFLRSGE